MHESFLSAIIIVIKETSKDPTETHNQTVIALQFQPT